jgi:nitroreductase/NAD-dependent dihydropyrimidine dehydrogenase PreA subunit
MGGPVAVSKETCTDCGLCAEVCPNKILAKSPAGFVEIREDRAPLCFACGQCMCVCPSASVQVDGLSYDKDFFAAPEPRDRSDSFFDLVRGRRAIRNFRDTPVPREVLDRVVEAISFAPPGFPPSKIDLVVVRDRDKIREALPAMIDFYGSLLGAMKNPFARMAIRKSVGRRTFRTMAGHLVPLMRSRMSSLRDGTEDTLTRGAPALILLLAERKGEDVTADAYIAAAFGMLAAHSLGLGGSVMDILPPAIDRRADLRRLFKVPEDREVVASMILGYPKYRYLRSVRRALKSVTWV